MATVDPFDFGLDEGKELPRQLLPVGWRKFYLTDWALIEKNEETDEWKRYIRLDLQDDETSWKRTAYVNVPIPGDEDAIVFEQGDRKITKKESKIGVIKKVVSCFGGPEGGGFSGAIMDSLVGKAAMFNITHEMYQEEMRDRVDIAFGRGIKPA